MLETLAAFGIFAIAATLLFVAVVNAARWNGALAERQSSDNELEGLAARLESEEDSAWAIFTPPSDGHELDFFVRDARSRAHFWAYRYDAVSQTLQRLAYASPGGTAVRDGPPLTGITAFLAQTYPITALGDSASPVYSNLYANAALTPAAMRFGFTGHPEIAGGNQITYVRVATKYSVRELQLSTQTAPSGFTVVLRYTPAPSPAPSSRLSAAIASSQVFGRWQDCPDPSKDCSNAEWPQYHWTKTITTRYYASSDNGYSWTPVNSIETDETGVSGPTGGDLPSATCDIPAPADFARACSPDWLPAAPPGTAGLDLTP